MKMKLLRPFLFALFSFAIAVPVSGFICGFVNCQDCGWNVVGRIFIGFVFAAMTVGGGFSPDSHSGVSVWPYFLGTFPFTFLLALYINRRSLRAYKRPPNQTLERTDSGTVGR
jgi:hypothetical protein